MAKYRFDKTEGLGTVVADKKLTVRTLEFKPTMSREDFIAKLRKCCYVKLGYTCGFYFKSASESQAFKNFFIVYAPKIKGALMRQRERGYSCWIAWKYVDSANVQILSKRDVELNYGFDLDKFYDSDWFEKSARQMRVLVMKHLNEVIKPYIEKELSSDSSLKREALMYAKAIEEAMQDITAVKQISTDDEGNERRSHTKDQETYGNREFDKQKDNEKRREEFKAWLASRK